MFDPITYAAVKDITNPAASGPLVNIGDVADVLGSTDPGVLDLDGQVLNRSDYPDLAVLLDEYTLKKYKDTSNVLRNYEDSSEYLNSSTTKIIELKGNIFQLTGASLLKLESNGTWTSITIPLTTLPVNTLYDYAAKNFIAYSSVTGMLKITYSTDGLTWSTPSELVVSSYLYSSTFGCPAEVIDFYDAAGAVLRLNYITNTVLLITPSLGGSTIPYANNPIKTLFLNDEEIYVHSFTAWRLKADTKLLVWNYGAQAASATSFELFSDGTSLIVNSYNSAGTVSKISASQSFDYGKTWAPIAVALPEPFASTPIASQGAVSSMAISKGKILSAKYASDVVFSTSAVQTTYFKTLDGINYTPLAVSMPAFSNLTVATTSNMPNASSVAHNADASIFVKPCLGQSSNVLYVSTDLADWQIVQLPVNLVWQACIWTGTKFLLIPVHDAHTLTSADGVTWEVHADAIPATGIIWNRIASNHAGTIVLTRGGAAGNKCLTSTDSGVTWILVPITDILTYSFWTIAANEVGFVAMPLATIASPASNFYFYSADGLTWTKFTGMPNNYTWNGAFAINTPTYGPEILLTTWNYPGTNRYMIIVGAGGVARAGVQRKTLDEGGAYWNIGDDICWFQSGNAFIYTCNIDYLFSDINAVTTNVSTYYNIISQAPGNYSCVKPVGDFYYLGTNTGLVKIKNTMATMNSYNITSGTGTWNVLDNEAAFANGSKVFFTEGKGLVTADGYVLSAFVWNSLTYVVIKYALAPTTVLCYYNGLDLVAAVDFGLPNITGEIYVTHQGSEKLLIKVGASRIIITVDGGVNWNVYNNSSFGTWPVLLNGQIIFSNTYNIEARDYETKLISKSGAVAASAEKFPLELVPTTNADGSITYDYTGATKLLNYDAGDFYSADKTTLTINSVLCNVFKVGSLYFGVPSTGLTTSVYAIYRSTDKAAWTPINLKTYITDNSTISSNGKSLLLSVLASNDADSKVYVSVDGETWLQQTGSFAGTNAAARKVYPVSKGYILHSNIGTSFKTVVNIDTSLKFKLPKLKGTFRVCVKAK